MVQQSLKKASSRASETTSTARDVAELSYDELKEQLASLKADMAELSSAIVKAGQEAASDASDAARKTGRKAASKASDAAERAADQVEVALHEAENFASKRPALALGIAAGVGALIALSVTRR